MVTNIGTDVILRAVVGQSAEAFKTLAPLHKMRPADDHHEYGDSIPLPPLLCKHQSAWVKY